MPLVLLSCRLHSARYLDLSGTLYTDVMPSQWTSLSRLVHLDLAQCDVLPSQSSISPLTVMTRLTYVGWGDSKGQAGCPPCLS